MMIENNPFAVALGVPMAQGILYLFHSCCWREVGHRLVKGGEYVSATVEVGPYCGSEDGMSPAKMWGLFVVSLLAPVAVVALVVLLLFVAHGWANGIAFTAAYWEQAGKIGVIYGSGVLIAAGLVFQR